MSVPTKPVSQKIELADGLQIDFTRMGKGEPVVFLQGSGPGASGWMNFRYNAQHFVDQGFEVIIPDLPGFGDSDKPDTDYTLDFFVESVVGFLDQLDLNSVSLVGNSLGGAVSLGVALAHPQRVEKLILMGCGGLEDVEVYFQTMEGIQAMTKIPLGSPEFTPEYLKEVLKLIVFDPKHITDELIEERYRILKTQNASVFGRMRIPNISSRLNEIKVPVLGFWGAQDRFCPISGAEKIVRSCDNAKMITLSQCGHWVMIEYAELFNRECTNFLRENS
ncbi:alpha/beta fold hydrolase [Pseudomaricurvus alkylphenolicus]|jgi:4,5:9,10-diseco-3-hydroxy-5,9,17-trioxoandrosta-1(10),2-diene-4-oate hydrolase|uniref:alpha/beta fold hydrolase n=1 Tax=Pseudomaricurvus alkylphenolicus TaxID=1306991 RepID=UPI00141FCE1A|nr:alpha/beta hydrolase [Pseudomaricurvus alkylphenolicus]NIB39230.1 alpha/beta fold hydrolase [Pseudomaricurvus alkylphenolicus]